mmetsp:Transcript_30838/g.64970  ORF Transcript_30838/g.64970 Transcript_30838/m.64970 type:complete len:244 (+) Transcript_30838:66-797(+)
MHARLRLRNDCSFQTAWQPRARCRSWARVRIHAAPHLAVAVPAQLLPVPSSPPPSMWLTSLPSLPPLPPLSKLWFSSRGSSLKPWRARSRGSRCCVHGASCSVRWTVRLRARLRLRLSECCHVDWSERAGHGASERAGSRARSRADAPASERAGVRESLRVSACVSECVSGRLRAVLAATFGLAQTAWPLEAAWRQRAGPPSRGAYHTPNSQVRRRRVGARALCRRSQPPCARSRSPFLCPSR